MKHTMTHIEPNTEDQVVDSLTAEAMESWLKDGTVPQEYLDRELGDQSKTFSPKDPIEFNGQ